MTYMDDNDNICFTYVLHMFHICFTYALHMFHICLHMFHICFTYVSLMFDICFLCAFFVHCFNVYLAGYLWACYRVEVLSLVQYGHRHIHIHVHIHTYLYALEALSSPKKTGGHLELRCCYADTMLMLR